MVLNITFKNDLSYKKILFFIFICIVYSIQINSQQIGSKKLVTLKIRSYQCGDNCQIQLLDLRSNCIYTFANTDSKTNDQGVFSFIQNSYYNNGESDKKIVGSMFKALLEYRYTDVFEYYSPDEPPRKTGKKKLMWMINSITK